MANSALKNNDFFNGRAAMSAPAAQQPHTQPGYGQQDYAQQGYGQAPQAPAYGQQGYQQPPIMTPEQLNQQFQAPAASRDQMDRMSYEDVIAKTAGLFAVVLVAAAVAWFFPVLAFPGAIGGLILSFVLAFKKTPSAPLSFAFALCEGFLVGGFSSILENQAELSGIVLQATLATFSVIGVTLLLFMNGKVRTSPRMTKIVMIAMLGYLVFSLLNFVLMLIPGVGSSMGAWGMRSVEVFGIPLGIIVGIFAVLMGAYMLVMDFEFIKRGVKSGAPRSYGWIAGYSLVSTVVFIYIEILRIIAIFRQN